MFELREVVQLDILPKASRRTKTRIKQYGPAFQFVKYGNPQCFDGIDSIFVRSFNNVWCGWFPLNEVYGTIVDD